MKTPLLYTIREKVIEGRRHIWSQTGDLLIGKKSFLPFRLLQHPSTPFRYVALQLADSGTWRSQKIHEFLVRSDEHLWSGVVSFRIRDYRNPETREQIRQFIGLIIEKEPESLLDFPHKFWDRKWTEWLFTYEVDPLRSFGTRIEQYIGKGTIWHKGLAACRITTEGSITQP